MKFYFAAKVRGFNERFVENGKFLGLKLAFSSASKQCFRWGKYDELIIIVIFPCLKWIGWWGRIISTIRTHFEFVFHSNHFLIANKYDNLLYCLVIIGRTGNPTLFNIFSFHNPSTHSYSLIVCQIDDERGRILERWTRKQIACFIVSQNGIQRLQSFYKQHI